MFSCLRCKKSFLCCNYFLKPAKLCSTKASNSSLIKYIRPKPVLLDKTKYKVVYEFPYIVITAALLRSKFSIPMLFSATVPFLIYFNEGIISVFFMLSAGFHYFCISLFAKISRGVVGNVYVNKETDIQDFIISTVDEKGRRIDRRHNPDDLINCDYPNKFLQHLGFIGLAVENSDVYYKVNVRHCTIYDVAVCNYLFGNKWILPFKTKKN